MRKSSRFILLWTAAVIAVTSTAQSANSSTGPSDTYDIVVYGGTSAGVTAAVQAKRMGKTAVIVCPDKHLGGLSAGGLGWTDSGRKEAVGGISREVYRRIKEHYDKPEAWLYQKPEQYSRYRPDDDAMWVFEPHVAEQTFEELVAEHRIPVFRNEWLKRKGGVQKDGSRIVSITMLSGRTYRGGIFIDATCGRRELPRRSRGQQRVRRNSQRRANSQRHQAPI
jgi:flavin-dependent dehydrogenase